MLARRDHSRADLRRKLSRHVRDEHEPAELERVLDELERSGLLSDERFARALTRVRSQRFGDARLRHDLRRFGVANETSEMALQALAGSEIARARDVHMRRFGAPPSSSDERAKQARFLQSRGFSIDTILQVLRDDAER